MSQSKLCAMVSLLLAVIGATALFGWAFGFAFTALASALLAAHGSEGIMAPFSGESCAASLGRRLLIVAILLPLVLGGVALNAARIQVVSNDSAMDFLIIGLLTLFATAVIITTRALRRAESEREMA